MIRDAKTDAEIPEGLIAPVTGLTWRDGLLYVTHRSRISTLDPNTGEFTTIVSDPPAWGEFQNNKVIFGPDDKMYFFVSTQTNSGPVGEEMMVILDAYGKQDKHEIPCQDVTLTGKNFPVPNLFTPNPTDEAMTGVYVPFGTTTQFGQVISGAVPCNGAFFRANPDGTGLELFAWGLRSDFGYRFDEQGRLIASQNSGNLIAPRPVYDDWETIWVVEEGKWYGWPDYFSGLPITDERFALPEDADFKGLPELHNFVLTRRRANRCSTAVRRRSHWSRSNPMLPPKASCSGGQTSGCPPRTSSSRSGGRTPPTCVTSCPASASSRSTSRRVRSRTS